MKHMTLGVNIDHIATLRQARGNVTYPDPVHAACVAEQSGGDGITIHVREDRRHIQDRDAFHLRAVIQTKLNLEMAATESMLALALELKPEYCCLVPEKREERTTEGGLALHQAEKTLSRVIESLKNSGIAVSLFINASINDVEQAKKLGADVVELHTGPYAHARSQHDKKTTLQALEHAANHARALSMEVHAGHGLHYHNIQALAAMEAIQEFNIGHAIISRAVFAGLAEAVREMKTLITQS